MKPALTQMELDCRIANVEYLALFGIPYDIQADVAPVAPTGPVPEVAPPATGAELPLAAGTTPRPVAESPAPDGMPPAAGVKIQPKRRAK